MTGQIDILNVGAGHLEIGFKKDDQLDVERARRIIGDMLKRGYALFVHGNDDALIRVKRFDAKHDRYIIADGPTVPAEAEPVESPRPGRKRKDVAVPMTKAKVSAIGRSAGG